MSDKSRAASEGKQPISAEDEAVIADLDFFLNFELLENDDKWQDVESESDNDPKSQTPAHEESI